MKKIDRTKPVLVTGGTGYVAGAIIKKLLKEKIKVHVTVRDLKNKEKLYFLKQLQKKHTGSINYFEADLLIKNSFEKAMKGCELVIHTASPFKIKVKDPQKDLLDPALLGTQNVLDTATKSNSVKRIVLTSSVAAIYGDAKDITTVSNGVFTENNWNESSSLTENPYAFSKLKAEQKAWEISKQQTQWDLVVINPSLVIGPGLNPNATSESFKIVRQLGSGVYKYGVPHFSIPIVDIRDVATAHYKAGFLPEANGRYIVSGTNTNLYDMAQVLKSHFGESYSFPKFVLPKFVAKLFASKVTYSKSMIEKNVGFTVKMNTTKSLKELSLNYYPMRDGLVGVFQQMIENGRIKIK